VERKTNTYYEHNKISSLATNEQSGQTLLTFIYLSTGVTLTT